MKWSELPKEYQDLEIYNDAIIHYSEYDFNSDDIDTKFKWSKTKQGHWFWEQCHFAKTINELPLPPLPQKEFVLPKKWCIKADQDSDVHMWFNEKLNRYVYLETPSYFHYPELPKKTCTTFFAEKGYTIITYEQWVKYVRDAEYKENAINDNHISEVKEPIEPFYMVYVDGASGSTKKHDNRNSAITEAHRLSKETDKKVFILRSEYCFERKVDINLVPIKKDNNG